MARLRKCLWTVAAVAALPAPAAAADICTALQRIVASAGEPVPFDSVRRAAAGGEAVVPGFLPEDCSVTGEAVSCDHRAMAVTQFSGWPNPLPCPGFVAAQPTERRTWHRDRVWAYAAGPLRIEYGTDCAMCAGPGSAYFAARVARAGADR
jgi:hypothetical protein